MLYQRGAHNGNNMGDRMHSYPIYQDFQQKARRSPKSCAGAWCRPRSAWTIRPSAWMLEMVSGQLFHDAGREASGRAGFQFAGGRPGVSGPSGGGAELRLLGDAFRARSEGGREEDTGQQLSDDDRGSVGTGVRRDGSGGVSADPGPDSDGAGYGAGVELDGSGRSAHSLGAGFCAIEARAIPWNPRGAPMQGLVPPDPRV